MLNMLFCQLSRCTGEGLFHDEIKGHFNDHVLTKCFVSYSREPGQLGGPAGFFLLARFSAHDSPPICP